MRTPVRQPIVSRAAQALVLHLLLLAGGGSLARAQEPAGASAPRPGMVGQACTDGEFGFGSGLLICENSTFRYALRADLPPRPDGGYTSRPEWFPKLTQVLGGPDTQACPLTGRVTFTHPVMHPDHVYSTIPQGMMVADHVTPIDHGYLTGVSLTKFEAQRTDQDWVPIYAPADGIITELSTLGSPTSIRVVIRHACDTYSIYMVLNRVAGKLASYHDSLMANGSVRIEEPILAGDIFGEQRDNPIDFSVHDAGAWLPGFASPFSYTTMEGWKPYTVDPWDYFSPDLAEAYRAKMQRVSAPRWGVIDQDVPGTASGNWFVAGTMGYSGQSEDTYRNATEPVHGGMVPGKKTYAWSHLALARHWVQPNRWIFSTGSWADAAGDPQQFLMDLPEGTPDPGALTPASGVVVYRVHDISFFGMVGMVMPIGYEVSPGVARGIVAIRVNDDESLTVEARPGVTDKAAFTGFTDAARTYRR